MDCFGSEKTSKGGGEMSSDDTTGCDSVDNIAMLVLIRAVVQVLLISDRGWGKSVSRGRETDGD